MKHKLASLKNKINFDEEKFKEKSKSLVSSATKTAGIVADKVTHKTKEIYDNRKEISENVVAQTKVIGNKTKEVAQQTGESIKNIDLFNSKLRQKAVDDYNELVEAYEVVAVDFAEKVNDLYISRTQGLEIIKTSEALINSLANTPRKFEVELKKINTEIVKFESKQQEILDAEKEAKIAAAGAGTGATFGALGIAVATLGPTAAMGIATTFGVASTGTAISTLSGAVATNAALAWLGGGALAAGGGGMSAGSALLALAGPVGWTLAGVALTASVGSGLFASNKNKEATEVLVSERKNLEVIKKKFEGKTFEVSSLNEVTKTQLNGLEILNKQVYKKDYASFTDEEKLQAGVLVNSTFVLAELINKELLLDD